MPTYKTWKYEGDTAALVDKSFRTLLERNLNETITHNNRVAKELFDKDQQIGRLIAEVYGDSSRQYKYWHSQRVPNPPKLDKVWAKLMREFAKWQVAERERQRGRDYRRRSREAREVLEAQGYEYGKHFGGDAITFAKQVLVEIEPGVYGNRMLPAPKGNQE